ncbi:MAG: tyrosine--tRNA ligase [Candidatus Promineifilaceae bacterium]
MSNNLFDELKWRGLVYDSTEGASNLLATEKVSVYNGFDPTGDSLHVGHLVPMVGLARLQRYGHHPIALAGGGTGMIGDPSGRSNERNLLSLDLIRHNVECIQVQLASILDFEVKTNPARIVNNYDWLKDLSMIEYLRDVGKHFTINYMLGKDSVKNRIGRESGLSYTEFSYMLLQSYDFLHLHDTLGVMMQTGGSDQWGNITGGTQLIRKVRQKPAQAMVYPLITRADGTKFGKTADGTSVWLDPKKTSPYRFYQFFINTEDSKVLELMRFYTFLSQDQMAEYEVAVVEQPHRRGAQKRLAQEVTRMVHGDTALSKAEQATAVLFGGSLDGLDSADIADIFAEVPSSNIAKSALEGDGVAVADLLANTTLASSKGDARRSLKGGSMNLNNVRITNGNQRISLNDAIEGQFIVLRKGKKKYHLVKVEQ